MNREAVILASSLIFGLLTLGPPSSGRAEERATSKTDGVSSSDLVRSEAAQLAAKIDRLFEASWTEEEITPAPRSDDAEFLRRVHLDLAGRIPSVSVVRAFLADKSPDKRQRVVERLLASPAYVNHFTSVWRDAMLPEARTDPELRYQIAGFEVWLKKMIVENARYDAMAQALFTASPTSAYGSYGYRRRNRGVDPSAYYFVKKFKPEVIAASTANLFLGIQLQCAQCHDHPFATWRQKQFWEFAAFFASVENLGLPNQFGGMREMTHRKELAIPGKNQVAEARFPDGSQPVWTSRGGPRVTLAQWITSSENPYFSRAAVNRMWGHFFGTGLVDPIDDLNPENPPSHPEVLDELAHGLVAHDFDLKFLIRAITAARAYELSSVHTHPSQGKPRDFAVMAVKAMSAEQLFDSLEQATGFVDPRREAEFFEFESGRRAEFISRFSNTAERPTEAATTILQALAMMNGELAAEVTSPQRSRTLAAVADAPFLDTAGRIETLYLAALSRLPRENELRNLVAYVDSGGAAGDRQKALADVFWALLNSAEFSLIH